MLVQEFIETTDTEHAALAKTRSLRSSKLADVLSAEVAASELMKRVDVPVSVTKLHLFLSGLGMIAKAIQTGVGTWSVKNDDDVKSAIMAAADSFGFICMGTPDDDIGNFFHAAMHVRPLKMQTFDAAFRLVDRAKADTTEVGEVPAETVLTEEYATLLANMRLKPPVAVAFVHRVALLLEWLSSKGYPMPRVSEPTAAATGASESDGEEATAETSEPPEDTRVEVPAV